MNRFSKSLTLLFVARQGYWTDGKQHDSISIVPYILPYMLGSVGVLFLFLAAPAFIEELLALRLSFLPISYKKLLLLALFVVLVAGVTCENYYLVKNRTKDTMSLFFGVKGRWFHVLLLIKNLLLALPFILLGQFFFPKVTIMVFLLTHMISYLGLELVKIVDFNKPHFNIMVSYLLSVIDVVSLCRLLLRPVIQMGIFFGIYTFFPNFLSLKLDHPLVLSVFLGSLGFYDKGLVYYFIALIKDIPYLRMACMTIEKWLNDMLTLILSINSFVILIPAFLFGLFQQWTFIDLLLFLFGLMATYLGFQGYQMLDSLYFKDKNLPDVRAVETYKFTWVTRRERFLRQWLLFLLYPLAILFRNYLTIYSFLVVLILLLSFIVNYRKVIKVLAED